MSDETSEPLSNELAALERCLAGRAMPGPNNTLRERVLDAVDRELAFPRRIGWRGAGRRLLATAAAVALLLNLSTSLIHDMDWGLSRLHPPTNVVGAARRVQGLAPELSQAEATRQAALLLAAAQAPSLPDFRTTVRWTPLRRHMVPWDTQ